ncbi:uncharacterized protein METZ01_LOCUS51109 [marine metagenome]|uniref:Uncharacterized protein n=1 Tax=marine metagenome TaxID=408172 RepID=A0A381S2B9_9ZZZZ
MLKIDLIKFFAAIFILMVACIVRAKRLQYILYPLDKNISLHHLFSSTMIGYFGNGILFFRFGEILKAYSISQGNKITTSESFGIIMLERVIDALTVLILLLMFLPWMPIQNITINYWVSAFAVVTVLFTLIILILRKINWKNFITSLSFINESFRSLLVSMMEKIFDGIDAIKNTKHTWGILISTFLIWICYYLMTVWLLESCQIYLTLSGAFIMLLMGSIIIAVPALPGGLGTYEAGITFTLMLLFYVTKDEALTYAIVSHASNYFPYIIVGSIYFIISGLKISDIKNKANS